MNERGNEIFVRDRMNRDGADYEGSGVGEGRYDAGEERANKFKEILLPLALLAFMVIYWILVIGMAYKDIYNKSNSIKYVVEFKDFQTKVTIDLPDGRKKDVAIEEQYRYDKQMTIYYNVKDDSIYVTDKKNTWILYSAFGAVVTVALLYWMKKLLIQKKHAVEKKPEHSYKDY